jgi:hypothetical protein
MLTGKAEARKKEGSVSLTNTLCLLAEQARPAISVRSTTRTKTFMLQQYSYFVHVQGNVPRRSLGCPKDKW